MANVITEQKAHRKPEFHKYETPLLRMGTCPENANGIFNPATIQNGVLHIYCREENLERRSVISCYQSRDGMRIDKKARVVLRPSEDPSAPDSVGCEDGRGYFDSATGLAYIAYVGHNGKAQVNMLAVSEKPYDFLHFRKLGPLFNDGLKDKDGSPMGRTPEGRFVFVRRPMIGETGWGLRIAVGKDITGPYEDVAEYNPRAGWEGERIGASQFVHVPDVGYIGMHHGAVKPNGHWVYTSGLDLFDENGRMIASAAEPQIVPTTRFEKEGVEGKAVALATGAQIEERDGIEYLVILFGGGDHCVMRAEAPLKDSINYLRSPECSVEKPEKSFFSFN